MDNIDNIKVKLGLDGVFYRAFRKSIGQLIGLNSGLMAAGFLQGADTSLLRFIAGAGGGALLLVLFDKMGNYRKDKSGIPEAMRLVEENLPDEVKRTRRAASSFCIVTSLVAGAFYCATTPEPVEKPHAPVGTTAQTAVKPAPRPADLGGEEGYRNRDRDRNAGRVPAPTPR